jgi:hypothetical protein
LEEHNQVCDKLRGGVLPPAALRSKCSCNGWKSEAATVFGHWSVVPTTWEIASWRDACWLAANVLGDLQVLIYLHRFSCLLVFAAAAGAALGCVLSGAG